MPFSVDFLIQRENDIFPVEVKSEANTTSKSLKKFKELFPDQVRLRIRFSLNNLKLDDDVLNIPLFMADHADRLIGLALEQRQMNALGLPHRPMYWPCAGTASDECAWLTPWETAVVLPKEDFPYPSSDFVYASLGWLKISSVSPLSMIRPSFMTMIRSHIR